MQVHVAPDDATCAQSNLRRHWHASSLPTPVAMFDMMRHRWSSTIQRGRKPRGFKIDPSASEHATPMPVSSIRTKAKPAPLVGIRCRICSVRVKDNAAMERHLKDCLGTLELRQRTSTYDHVLRRHFDLTKAYVHEQLGALSHSGEVFEVLCGLAHRVQHLLLRYRVVWSLPCCCLVCS